MTSSTDPHIVLVTGGAGFLGQHVVGLLQTRADHVTEIRVLDMVPYVNKLDYEAYKPVRQYVGSINDHHLVRKACEGVQCVMHLASFIDISLLPDKQFSHKVNVLGTQVVIDACREAGVRRLIYCSTFDVAIGKDNVHNGSESSRIAYDDNYFGVYGQTKAMAEKLVLDANDSQLQTVSLRPFVMYGEQDMLVVRPLTDMAKKCGATFVVSNGKGKKAHAYVGNVAWGFVCTEIRLNAEQLNAKDIAGNAFFIGDETPHQSKNELFGPMLTESGFKLFPLEIPLWIVVCWLYFLYFILSLISLIYRVNFPYSVAAIASLSRSDWFSYEKAKRVIGYKPLYTYEEARVRSIKFMKSFRT